MAEEFRERLTKPEKERELKKRRNPYGSIQACETEFRHLVQRWAKGKKEVKCPMEPCHDLNSIAISEKILRLNKCGYKKISYNIKLPHIIPGCDWWSKDYRRKYNRAWELESILYEMA